MACDELVVATEIAVPGSRPIYCGAAPIVLGTLRRQSLPARLGVLTSLDSTARRVPILVNFGLREQERSAAVEIPADDPTALVEVQAVLRATAQACRVRRLVLASPRSFCAGVERAIEVVKRVLAARGAPLYVRKQIVHNAHVVRQLEEQGAVFVEELDAVPPGATVVFSAHGVSPEVRFQAEQRSLEVIDATCPLVTKVHTEARRFAQLGDTIVFIGHAGHEETEGTLGEAVGQMVLVQSAEEVADIEIADPQRISYLTQTTLAVDETELVVAALRARFPAIKGPRSEDICYATTNRQNAMAAVLPDVDVMLVVGSRNSSNSLRLVELARRSGVPAYLVDDATDIRLEWLAEASTVGLTAGASAPPPLVDGVVHAVGGLGPVSVEEQTVAREDIEFALPRSVFRATSPAPVPASERRR